MRVEDTRNKKEANIGDIIITDKGNIYTLILNDVKESFPIAIVNLESDRIIGTTSQKVFVVGGTLVSDNIVEIIPKSKVKIIIE